MARKGYSLEADIMPIIKGKVPLPNFEELPLETGIAHIAAGGGLVTIDGVNNAKFEGSDSNWGHWARYWLRTTQGGALSGEGYVIFWDRSKGRVARFAICKHEHVNTSNPERERYGYHRGHCAKCGLDMSVDSSRVSAMNTTLRARHEHQIKLNSYSLGGRNTFDTALNKVMARWRGLDWFTDEQIAEIRDEMIEREWSRYKFNRENRKRRTA